MLFEHLSTPLPLSNLKVPDVYTTIARDPGNFSVLELPLAWRIQDSTAPTPGAIAPYSLYDGGSGEAYNWFYFKDHATPAIDVNGNGHVGDPGRDEARVVRLDLVVDVVAKPMRWGGSRIVEHSHPGRQKGPVKSICHQERRQGGGPGHADHRNPTFTERRRDCRNGVFEHFYRIWRNA